MPIESPVLDRRRYQEIYEEVLARIPVHTREWTNLNPSDPGITLLQLFAWLTESLLYRVNQIPERNRRKFLQLLGVPLYAASPAMGLVTLTNERGPLQTLTLSRELEVRAGQIPFRTTTAIDVLPLEARAYFKRRLSEQPEAELDLYAQLYASFAGSSTPPATVELYELTPLEARSAGGVDLAAETVDASLWIALLARAGDPIPSAPDPLAETRRAIQNRTLSLGLVPLLNSTETERRLTPATAGGGGAAASVIQVQLPNVADNRRLPTDRQPTYRTITSIPLPAGPTVAEIPLPDLSRLFLWEDLEPLDAGADLFPPSLEDTAQQQRVITWLRLVWPEGVNARLLWAGINVSRVAQREHVANELLPDASGEPDQSYALARRPVLADSVVVTITPRGADSTAAQRWERIDDLLAAGPEVVTEDFRVEPGTPSPTPRPAQVFVVDGEAGRLTFGDGLRGARPPLNATIRVDYDFSAGRAGNVAAGEINTSPTLPQGYKVSNPVRTWGGTDAEPVVEGEKQVTRVLQHRERLVSAADFETITLRTPGVDLGRVEVLPAFNPLLARNDPGNAPGVVTLLVIPRFSASRPDAPSPDAEFLRAVCAHLEPRRLVTTELILRGPDYVPVWISVGIEVVAGFDTPTVRDAVAQRLRAFLAPLRANAGGQLENQAVLRSTPGNVDAHQGWPLRRPVQARELEAEVARVPGVALINQLELGGATGSPVDRLEMKGLQLPRLDGISVTTGDALPLAQVRGDGGTGGSAGAAGSTGGTTPPPRRVPVPAVPREC